MRIITGNCLDVLATLPDRSAHCCVTSPPYWGLRDYGQSGQLGMEKTPEEYTANMVAVCREVRRVLRDDGTLWLNLGDSYAASRGGTHMPAQTVAGGESGKGDDNAFRGMGGESRGCSHRNAQSFGLKHKDLVGIPWRVAFALQADGWYLRSDIIWAKPNPMPESVTDRCTKSHEYIFMLSKNAKYYYDAEAIKEPISESSIDRIMQKTFDRQLGGDKDYGKTGVNQNRSMRRTLENFAKGGTDQMRNKRDVWTVSSVPCKMAHFATFPPKLIEPCVLAGCPESGTVLDPFAGTGTVGQVCYQHQRDFIGIDLDPRASEWLDQRIRKVGPRQKSFL